MREFCEFRVMEENASKLFAETEGKKLGAVRKVELETSDPRFQSVGRLQREIKESLDRSFFHGWDIRRVYSKAELAAAKCFQLLIKTTFEPAGEECGTKYDDAKACPQCGAGAPQVSELRLDLRKVPKGKDIARTIAGEVIVSQRLAALMVDAKLTGIELRRVRHKDFHDDDSIDLRQLECGRDILQQSRAAGAPYPSDGFWVWINREENHALWEQARAEYLTLKGRESLKHKPPPTWHQLVVSSAQAEIVSPTRVGINPFDDDPDGECRCPLGDLIGLNLLSEISLKSATRGTADAISTRQYIGVRRGLLPPEREIVISAKFWKLLESEKVKGYEVEVAYLS